VGAMRDEEDAAKGFGVHSDQERVLEEAVSSIAPGYRRRFVAAGVYLCMKYIAQLPAITLNTEQTDKYAA
jgi:hypothetical protein